MYNVGGRGWNARTFVFIRFRVKKKYIHFTVFSSSSVARVEINLFSVDFLSLSETVKN